MGGCLSISELKKPCTAQRTGQEIGWAKGTLALVVMEDRIKLQSEAENILRISGPLIYDSNLSFPVKKAT